ncbi:MAG TPA: hypothetical protein VFC82_07500 [Actinomycetaceae bacterium]|nr:hypothetical protein [Actinomycetaceae bacterium]
MAGNGRPPAPIIRGNDVSAYAMARSFHEAYGVTSTAVVSLPRGPINDSSIVTQELLGRNPSDEDVMQRLSEVAARAREAGSEPVLLVTSDSQVDLAQRHRAWFEERMKLMIPPPDTYARIEDKSLLHGLAAEVGLKAPQEVTIGTGDEWLGLAARLTPPYVIKAKVSAEYETVRFPDQRKAYYSPDMEEAKRIVGNARDGGFHGDLLLQELIPGDDTHNYVATLYRDGNGVVTLTSTMRMLLALHRPNRTGTCAIGLVSPYPQISEPVARLVEIADYRGFATVDVKVHSHTGERYLLDVNARIGASNHFVNVGGVNPVEVAWDDLNGVRREPVNATRRGIYRIVPFQLYRRYVNDKTLRAQVRAAVREGGTSHPLAYDADRHPKRAVFRGASSFNNVKAMLRDYPEVTDTGF